MNLKFGKIFQLIVLCVGKQKKFIYRKTIVIKLVVLVNN